VKKELLKKIMTPHFSIFMLALSVIIFYRREIIWLWGTWVEKGYDSYGYMAVILFILYFLRYGFRFKKSRPEVLCIILFTVIAGIFVSRLDINILNTFFFISAVSLFLYYISEAVRENPSSLLLLFLSLPWINHINIFFGYGLRRICTVCASIFLRFYGIPVEVKGTMLYLNELRLEVGEPCSGSKYLFFAAFFMVILGIFMKQKTLILLPLSGVISLCCNILRIISIALLRVFLGKEEGIVMHNIIGIIYFLFALGGVYFLCKKIKSLKWPCRSSS